MPSQDGVTRIDERVDLEIVVGGTTTCAVTLTGTEIECSRQILNAVIDNILNAEQKAKRIAKDPDASASNGQDDRIPPFAGKEASHAAER